jgi:hypothetical protein
MSSPSLRPRKLLATVVTFLGCAAGCGDERSLAPDGASADSGRTTMPADAGAPLTCKAPRFLTDAPAADFEQLTARVIDVDGNAVANTLAQACGSNVCLVGETNAAGEVTIEGDQSLKDAAFKYGDGLHFAQFALTLDTNSVHSLGDQITVAFPELTSGAALVAGASLESQGARLTLTSNVDVSIDLLAFPDEEQHVFLAQSVTAEDYPEAAQVEPELAVLWALAPLKTKFCPPAQLRVPNNVELEPGTAVEFVLHGTDVAGAWAAYGAWGQQATGHVSDDGLFIETDADSGISQLGVIGIRALP